MAEVVQTKKKIALLHRHTPDQIQETNAAFRYLKDRVDVLTFKTFDRTSKWKFLKDILWMFYAPMLVFWKGYDVIYLDDSIPFYPIFVKLASPRSKVILRLGDFHLMYYTSGILYNFLHFFEKIGWRMADEIISISEPMRDYVGRGKVVLDPVDHKDFPINGSQNHGTVMFHGLLTKNKNVDILLEAAKLLQSVNFVIIGDGPDCQRLEKIAPHNVFFKGWIPHKNIHRYIATCAVGVALRSDNPGNEYVVTSPFLQYGVMGKPCLVTRRKVFGDYLWQFEDVEELVIKIKALLVVPGFSESEGQKLREYILKNHDAERIAEEIWSVLSS